MNRANVEALLVGLALPATKDEILAYAREQPGGDRAAARLARIPDREYAAIQDVGEELEPVQPDRSTPRLEPATVESDAPPGGPAYLGDPVEPANVAARRGERA
jgi:hypothetical protein